MIIHCCFQFFPILIVNFFQFFSNTTPLLHRVWWKTSTCIHITDEWSNIFILPKINPFKTFHPFSCPLEDPNCQMWKDFKEASQQDPSAFRLLSSVEKNVTQILGERSAVGISYEKRHAGYTGADKMNDNGVEFRGNDKTRWIYNGIPEGRDSKRS